MPFLRISHQQTLHYIDENPQGSPTVLLLHGLGANGSSWILQFAALTKSGYRVIAPDTPGFGQSLYSGGKNGISKMTACMADLLSHLHPEAAHVVGISMGGVQALQLCLDYPSLVKKLVLVNTFASPGKLDFKVLPYFALRFILVHTLDLKIQAKFVANRIFTKPDQQAFRQELINQICLSNPQAYRASMRALIRFNVVNRLNEISHPTLVITGDRDTTVPKENQIQLANGIQNARHQIIPDAGHAVTIEQPDVFNQYLLEFLNYEA